MTEKIMYKGLERFIYPKDKFYQPIGSFYEEFFKNFEREGHVSSVVPLAPYVRETLDHLGMTDTEVSLINGSLHVGDTTVDVQPRALLRLGFRRVTGRQASLNLEGYCVMLGKKARIQEGPLGDVMGITGHELGHLFTPRLLNQVDEEAKAYAFEYAWCKVIEAHNTRNLGNKPLKRMMFRAPFTNPHYEAHKYVMSQIETGRNPMSLYREIADCEPIYPGFRFYLKYLSRPKIIYKKEE